MRRENNKRINETSCIRPGMFETIGYSNRLATSVKHEVFLPGELQNKQDTNIVSTHRTVTLGQ